MHGVFHVRLPGIVRGQLDTVHQLEGMHGKRKEVGPLCIREVTTALYLREAHCVWFLELFSFPVVSQDGRNIM